MTSRSRAQSDTVGVLLLTGVVVVTVWVGGALYLGNAGFADEPAPLVDADVELTPTDLVLAHVGGDALGMSDVRVIVRSDESSNRYPVESLSVDRNGDDRFEPGEEWATAHGLPEGTYVTVILLDRTADEILDREYATVPPVPANTPPRASLSVTPSTPASGVSVKFDASDSFGDGGVVEYRWDWNGDGRVNETTSDHTATHAWDGSGQYTVVLTVVDAAGATDSVTRTVSVGGAELALAEVSITDDGDGLVAPGDEVTVVATVAETGVGVDSITADASAFDAGTVMLTDDDGDGTYSRTFVVGESPSEGEHTVTVTATDTAGNTTSVTTEETIAVDATPPTLSFDVRDDSYLGAWYGQYVEAYQIQWEASDSRAGVAETTVVVNRNGETQDTYEVDSGDRGYSYERGLWVYSGREHSVRLVAVDSAGNRACRTVTDTADGEDPPNSAYHPC